MCMPAALVQSGIHIRQSPHARVTTITCNYIAISFQHNSVVTESVRVII